ncbi:peroxisome proliferator-activated receptor gamma coactivator 1-alpha-like, partial [Clupea harengus]|uniref:Peroxisome proliferator-activated receptor gamma coactivator 1-alpha-like n=1 Tax=Clupea harengus TaxID=7950 RepID=A0A8M1KL44_CLUHA
LLLLPPPCVHKKIDEEQEANLLAVLTETLDSLPVDVDDEGLPLTLPSFEVLSEGQVPQMPQGPRATHHSCPSSPAGSPHSPEPEEPSLLKKLLLAPPANSQISSSQHPPGHAPHHALNQRHRHTHTPLKVEQPWLGKRGCDSLRRPCTELLKYLTTGGTSEPLPPATVAKETGGVAFSCSSSSSPSSLSTSSSCSSSSSSCKKKSSSSSSSSCSASFSPSGHAHLLPQRATPSTLTLPLTPESPTGTGSPPESKAIERTLSVEISGTPGLTPPTTPPHKPHLESPFPPSALPPPPMPSAPPPPAAVLGVPGPPPPRRPPQQTELYAQLRKEERHRVPPKRPAPRAPRAYGDHDYCQAAGTKLRGAATVAMATAAAPLSKYGRMECTDLTPPPPVPTRNRSDPPSARPPLTTSRTPPTPLRDQQICAELDRHFGRRPPPSLQAPPTKHQAARSEEEEEDEEDEEGVLTGVEEGDCELGGYGGGLGGGLAELFPWEGDGRLDLPLECSPPHTSLFLSPLRRGSRSRSPHTHTFSW